MPDLIEAVKIVYSGAFHQPATERYWKDLTTVNTIVNNKYQYVVIPFIYHQIDGPAAVYSKNTLIFRTAGASAIVGGDFGAYIHPTDDTKYIVAFRAYSSGWSVANTVTCVYGRVYFAIFSLGRDSGTNFAEVGIGENPSRGSYLEDKYATSTLGNTLAVSYAEVYNSQTAGDPSCKYFLIEPMISVDSLDLTDEAPHHNYWDGIDFDESSYFDTSYLDSITDVAATAVYPLDEIDKFTIETFDSLLIYASDLEDALAEFTTADKKSWVAEIGSAIFDALEFNPSDENARSFLKWSYDNFVKTKTGVKWSDWLPKTEWTPE